MDRQVISRDIDFLAPISGGRAEVVRLAKLIGGVYYIPPKEALTALVGQAFRETGQDQFVNIDVLFKVFGANEAKVRDTAVEFKLGADSFFLMHPMDVLKSRLDNLYGLREKQGELGQFQLAAAIQVGIKFQHAVDSEPREAAGRSPTLPFAKFIERLALSDAGRKVAERTGIHIADAIAPELVSEPGFRTRKLPQLLRLMSEARRAEIEDQQAPPDTHVNRPKA